MANEFNGKGVIVTGVGSDSDAYRAPRKKSPNFTIWPRQRIRLGGMRNLEK